jgi:WD40 repeat protein
VQENHAEPSETLFQTQPFDTINEIWVSPNGKFIVVQGGVSNNLVVFRWDDGGNLHEVGSIEGTTPHKTTQSFPDIAFHPKEPIIAIVGEERSISIWNLEDLRSINSFNNFNDPGDHSCIENWGIAFSHDGKFLQTHVLSDISNQFYIGVRYKVQTGKLIGKYRYSGSIIVRSPCDSIVATSSISDYGSNLFFGKWDSNNEFVRFSPKITSELCFTKIIFGPGFVGFFGGTDYQGIQINNYPDCTFRFYKFINHLSEEIYEESGPGSAFAIAPDGTSLYYGSISGYIVELSIYDGSEIQRWKAHDGMITCMASHPANPWVVTGSSNGILSVSKVGEHRWDSTPNHSGNKFTEKFNTIGSDPEEHIIFKPPEKCFPYPPR